MEEMNNDATNREWSKSCCNNIHNKYNNNNNSSSKKMKNKSENAKI